MATLLSNPATDMVVHPDPCTIMDGIMARAIAATKGLQGGDRGEAISCYCECVCEMMEEDDASTGE